MIEYPVSEFVPPGSSHNNHPPPSHFGLEVVNQPVFPWDGLPQRPETSINGGTFIGGNVNHIQHHGEPGEY
jgi:hypothetical protein